MSFELTFLGSSGGPLEGSTCSILVKPSHIPYKTIIADQSLTDELICIDAGCGIGQLADIIHHETATQKPQCKLLDYYPDSHPISDYYHKKVTVTTPFSKLAQRRAMFYSQTIFNLVSTYLITHPHLDHVASLVINSAGFCNSPTKQVYGSSHTIDALQRHLFNGVIWPNMPSFEILNLIPVQFTQPTLINNSVYTITMFKLSHGELNKLDDHRRRSVIAIPTNGAAAHKQHYSSSAYLVKHNITGASLLVFGDFESDIISKLNRNQALWKAVAPFIISKKLKGIVVECSNSSNVPEDELYGHLTPSHLVYELNQLRKLCIELDPDNDEPLRGLNIVVNHIKDPIVNFECGEKQAERLKDPRYQVLSELNKLNEVERLHCRFSIALSGVSLII
ncbi:3',5'-cyclic-nucleotide phosphodiesterase (3':5'-CNP) [Spathaspora passalidarum NRRL Y-27907]|uniref:3',5'-cyclic-nucleotide phosphodiesterase (3':5'-CNP) n=1 Tax=Spathaspora passalidarum (strain NRRL Y-27907 / 11-Y1) TaxID=619300 RepID=G3APD5_SPAPN|nr:3',5'-cyclic-nucleotide phosphodiesterase (3':5'-CNP) [Spathaspora passalidarum NRRL Y-27907]EGW32112.1 3',5'-cyclic-nucleotide phosphodiesterase (3':5'-CNP) [Spathaspora passalidarum NRRL Y-27907]